MSQPNEPFNNIIQTVAEGMSGLVNIAFGPAVMAANAKAEARANEIKIRTMRLMIDALNSGTRLKREEVCKSLETDPTLADWEIAQKLDVPEWQVRQAIKRWYHIF